MKEKTPINHESVSSTRLYRAAATLFAISASLATYFPLKNPDAYNHGAVSVLLGLSVLGLVAAIGNHQLGNDDKKTTTPSPPLESRQPNLKS